MKVLLTGASGNLGSRVLRSILELKLINTADLKISTSSPEKLANIAEEHNLQLFKGDFNDSKQLQQTFVDSDAEILFLVSFPSPSIERWLLHKSVIDSAKASGNIKIIVYTSLMFGGTTGMKSVAGVQQAHIKTVEYLQTSGLDYVVIREGIYTESWWLYAGFQKHPLSKEDTDDINFVIPDDGPIGWVSWDDLAEGTARILSTIAQGQGQSWINQSLSLTGPRTTTISAIANLVEKYSGHKVSVNLVGSQKAFEYHRRDKEDWLIESWSGWYEGIKVGECAVLDPLLEDLLQRKPKGIEECAQTLFTPV